MTSRKRRPQAELLEDGLPTSDEVELPPPAEASVDAALGIAAAARTIDSLESRKPLRKTNARIRVPVTGTVELTPLEAAIVDTRAFQRLRKIRQLGGTYIVYPGASHSRFEHCLGVVEMAARMCDAVDRNLAGDTTLRITAEDRKLIRLAALLHDIGHLPYGHTLEDEVGLFEKHDSGDRLDTLLRNGEIAAVFQTHDPDHPRTIDDVIKILHKDPAAVLPSDKVFRADIVANTVCADLLDYLKRDIYHIGLKYAYDDRIFEYMTLARDRSGNVRFAIRLVKTGKMRHDAVTQIFELLNIRYILAEAVLFHHAKDAHSAMLSRALLESKFLLDLVCASRSAADGEVLTSRYLLDPGSQVASYFQGERRPDPNAIVELGDDELIAKLAADPNPVAATLARMIEGRQLYRTEAQIDYNEARTADSQAAIVRELHERPDQRFNLERLIEEELGLPRGSILLYCPSARMNAKVAQVHIVLTDTAVPLSKYEEEGQKAFTAGFLDAQIQRFQGLWRTYLFVHPALSKVEAERAARYLRARYHLFGGGTQTMNETQRESRREAEYRNLAAELYGERIEGISYARVQELRSGAVTIESRRADNTRKIRSYLEAFALAGNES